MFCQVHGRKREREREIEKEGRASIGYKQSCINAFINAAIAVLSFVMLFMPTANKNRFRIKCCVKISKLNMFVNADEQIELSL